MPWAPKKRCTRTGCHEMIGARERYCEEHQREKWKKAETHHVRERFYDSPEWQALRNWFRARNPLCAECLKHGITRAMYVVDHIIPISDGGPRLDPANLQSLCMRCHQEKRGRERHAKDLEDKFNNPNGGQNG